MGSQAGSKSWRLLGSEIVDRKGNLPELDVRGIDVGKPDWSLLLDEVFEDADIFHFRDLHSKHPILFITENEAVE